MESNIIYNRMRGQLIALGLLLFCFGAFSCKTVRTLPPPCHDTTGWNVKVSSGLDALCLLNGLSGNRLSIQKMRSEVSYWRGRLHPEEHESLEKLGNWQSRTGLPLHSLILKPFAACGVDSLSQAIELCDQSEKMQEALMKIQQNCEPRNTYYTKKEFLVFQSYLPEIKIILTGLKRSDFHIFWESSVKPCLSIQAGEVLEYAKHYNIIPQVESALGFRLPSNKVTIFLCKYLKPYGNHLLPGIFATETGITNEHVIRTAVHELLHDPCYNYDPLFWHTADLVSADDFIQTHYENRGSQYGYNSFAYYYIEDSVRAMEQYISMALGIATPLSKRFGPEEDGGMHVLAAVFYELMTRHGFGETGEGFREFIIRMGREGRLSRGDLKIYYMGFMDKTHG
jgi:hypothetical protein